MKKALLLLCTFGALQFSSPAAQAQTGKETALETMGVLSALTLYNTYLCIGAVGDAYEGQLYDADKVIDLMDEQEAGISTLSGQLTELLRSGFITSEDDKDYISSIIKTLDLLEDEATSLRAYARGLQPEDAEQFQRSRAAAWKNISEMMGLD